MPRRSKTDRAGFGVLTYFYSIVSLLGLIVTLGTGFLLVRGPFLGGTLLKPVPLMLALAGFVVGIVVLTWGATRTVGVGSRV
ncbi:hypothetical protein GL213_09100 [Halogeometricum borinquense]|uniref:DUF8132 domain-containing protein n=2 Tax=Halogeometricum borinquense TaxID=60847 RepID=E4NMY5_HALBP|nr:hypothetical protein [Halogeometricum borinquense]ADQ67397.1 hypothetical protein Hbor_18300 [Halogeometricum borinquense DSM 11551]ELY28609.1 hypothetical protein C499_08100 [Halogeometricum borinquense DSM 11551]QIB74128.1 hypothetical protein G3I44_07370 [Halogeometricum borinquense]QIQ76664.1 hypothetical protein GL213_09100 [Halogeometricum borinquense]RYJ13601.1 hypothetical protein ELS19_06285 [Halogeometricum borinquense]